MPMIQGVSQLCMKGTWWKQYLISHGAKTGQLLLVIIVKSSNTSQLMQVNAVISLLLWLMGSRFKIQGCFSRCKLILWCRARFSGTPFGILLLLWMIASLLLYPLCIWTFMEINIIIVLQKERYVVAYNPSKGNIYAVLKDQAKSDDILKAAFHVSTFDDLHSNCLSKDLMWSIWLLWEVNIKSVICSYGDQEEPY